MVQVEDVMDVMDVWFPTFVIVFQVDHSSGHDKFKPDGLNVNNQNAGFGGKAANLRTSLSLPASIIGIHPAIVETAKRGTFDVKLKAGDDQPMQFAEWDPKSDVASRGSVFFSLILGRFEERENQENPRLWCFL